MGVFKYEHVLDAIPDGITIQDCDFTVLYQNEAMKHAFGNCIGQKCYKVYERRDQICEECGVQKAFERNESVLVHRIAFTEDNSAHHWENACFPLHDKDGNIVAGVEVCRDVTERAYLAQEVRDRSIQLGIANDQLLQKKRELEKRSRELETAYSELQKTHARMLQQEKMACIGQLAAGLAHEINTPIQFVGDNVTFLRNSFSELIENIQQLQDTLSLTNQSSVELSTLYKQINSLLEQLDFQYLIEEIPLALEQASEGIRRVAEIVIAMKNFAHPGTLALGRVELDSIIRSTVEICRNAWKNVSELEMILENPTVVVKGNQGDIGQVLLNLIVNAADAVADNHFSEGQLGKIHISTHRREQWGEIVIKDNGSGIDPALLKRIFEPFFTTKEVGRGSGQGLAIAYNIVTDTHNGELLVDSEIGKGARFVIRLPLIE